MKPVTILGAGTWGIALAIALANAGRQVTVWSAIPEELDALKQNRTHPRLPGGVIPDSVCFEGDPARAVRGAELIVFAVPSPFVRTTARTIKPYLTDGQLLADAAKGLEEGSLFTMTEVVRSEIADTCPHSPVVALSGPTHAEEVAVGLPTAIVAACEDEGAARRVQDVFMSPVFRVYVNCDVRGVELAGALKNVMALGAGIAQGLGFGDNTNAAIITRGIAEMSRLGLAMGCRRETFSGLAGIGDLIVTCTSRHSRNNRAGRLIGAGMSPRDAVREVGMVVEGMNTLPAALALSARYGVELPIIEAVGRVVDGTLSPRDAVDRLMGRPKRTENEPE